MNRVAVLITCFNRKEKTVLCLKSLFSSKFYVDVFLVDDGSSDGTSQAVEAMFPSVKIFRGNGDLFWNRGMRFAWEEAAKGCYDFYLWLNDDVVLYENCFQELFDCAELSMYKAVIVGFVEEIDGSGILYGGTDFSGSYLKPNGSLQEIKNMNGNVVLVSSEIFRVVGNLDSKFHHDLGDVDYGFRVALNGYGVLSTRCAVASGNKNDFCRIRFWGANIKKRFSKLYSPLGSPPAINYYFRKKYFGRLNAVLYLIYIHILNVLPDIVVKYIFRDRYFRV